MKKLKIYNEFGINPTTNYTAAGLDFYIPDLTSPGLKDVGLVWNELARSYKTSVNILEKIGNGLVTYLLSDNTNLSEDFIYDNILNLVHLYCALDMPEYEDEYDRNIKYDEDKIHDNIEFFVESSLVIPKSEEEKFGISLGVDESVFFNSGIRVALPHEHAGIFFNKSGKGNAGFDVRSCCVDEDYTGLVHLSLAYTKDKIEGSKLYIGDKIIQMIILPIYLVSGVENLTKEEYDKIMEGSERGTNGFGSSDEKHDN